MDADGAECDGLTLRLRVRHVQVPQGISADLIATLEGFTRVEPVTLWIAGGQGIANNLRTGVREI